MRYFIICAAVVAMTGCSGQVSGQLGKACMETDRKAASQRICSCIQSAANHTLNASDQAQAAELLLSPDDVQTLKRSKGRSAKRLWSRYNAFTKAARGQCG